MTSTRSGDRNPSGESAAPIDHSGPRALGQIPALDGIRGIGLVLVVGTHALLGFGGKYRDALPGGFIGLDAFFVLSGFLITSLLLGEQARNGRISLRGFYRRRALRLLPALFLLLAVHGLYAIATNLSMDKEITSNIVVLGYATNWYRATGHVMALGMGHLWSLAVEEQFYFVWPIIIVGVLGIRRSPRLVYTVLVSGVVVVCVWRYYLWRHGTSLHALQERTDCRADSLLVGALTGQIFVRRALARVRYSTLAWPALALLTYVVWFLPARRAFWYAGGYTIVAIAAAILILAIAEGRWAGIALFNFAPFRKLGIVSYGVYLWHLPVFLVVIREMPNTSNLIRFIVAISLTAAFTAISWFGVERPCQRMKGGTRRKTLAPVPAGT
jgi:peptidoglycan/LPS O-acetylase OafA/YrhL